MKLWSCTGPPHTITKMFEAFQAEHPDVEIVGMHFTTVAAEDTIYVFYEDAGEQLGRDRMRLKLLAHRASELMGDESYAALKNQRQRELYLITRGLAGRDAADVAELLKPEMGSVLSWGLLDDV